MQQKKPLKKSLQVINFIRNEYNLIEKNYYSFGYKQRILIERGLFLLLKTICKEKIQYDLQGFSNNHIENLRKSILKEKNDVSLLRIVAKIFELKIFLQQLSSENAYVRGDSMTKLGLNTTNVISFIKLQVESILSKAIIIIQNS